MPRYFVTITSKSKESMADLIRKYHVQVSDHGQRYDRETGYSVEAIAEPGEISKLKAVGYHVERHANVDETGKARQKEVGQGNRYTDPRPSEPEE